jgi:hypothetical protein
MGGIIERMKDLIAMFLTVGVMAAIAIAVGVW